MKVLGKGNYATVFEVFDKNGNVFAMKMTTNIFDDQVDEISSALREICMFQMLKHPNICKATDMRLITDKHSYNNMQIYMDKYQSLDKMIENGVKIKNLKKFIYQLCSAVCYMHDSNIIHRDIKTDNILIDENQNVKLSDFGISTYNCELSLYQQDDISDKRYNDFNTFGKCCTLTYRPPELLKFFGRGHYSFEIDVWAIGMVIYYTQNGGCQKLYKDDNGKYNYSLYHIVLQQKQAIKWISQLEDKHLSELLISILDENPVTRIKLNDVLSHPYFDDYEHKLKRDDCWNNFQHLDNLRISKNIHEDIFTFISKHELNHRIIFNSLYLCDKYICDNQIYCNDKLSIGYACIYISSAIYGPYLNIKSFGEDLNISKIIDVMVHFKFDLMKIGNIEGVLHVSRR